MDKRKDNGGHSTKAKGFDKRKNQYKDVLNDSLTADDIKNVVKMLLDRSLNKTDVNAAKLLLEYYIGKPQQKLDITTNEESLNIPIIKFGGSDNI